MLLRIMCDPAAIGEVTEQGSDLLQLSFGYRQITKAAKHLRAPREMRPEVPLDQYSSILRGELLSLALDVALRESLCEMEMECRASDESCQQQPLRTNKNKG